MSFVLMRLQNGCCCSSYYYYHHSHYGRHHRRHHNHHLDHHQGHYHHRHGDCCCCCCCSGKYVNVMLRLRHLDLGRHWRDLMKTRDSQHDGMMIMLAGDGDGGGGLGGHELCCCCCSIFQLSPLCPHVRFPVYSMPLCMTDVCVCVSVFGVPCSYHSCIGSPVWETCCCSWSAARLQHHSVRSWLQAGICTRTPQWDVSQVPHAIFHTML